jgi:hypothetical protein
MRVRMTQQIQGGTGPDGNPWPAPGTEVDMSDADADAAIKAGTAVDASTPQPTVLVPPAGIHTPGTTITDAASSYQPLVEVPADALADPEGVRKALRNVQGGNYVKGEPGAGHQHADGSALSAEEAQQRQKDAAPAKSGSKTTVTKH